MEKVKFLSVSDIHSDEKLIKKIEKKVNLDDIDFVIIAGDISDKNDDFSKLLSPFKDKKIFMAPGNHDSTQQINSLVKNYNIELIGNQPIKINDKLWMFGTNYITLGEKKVNDDELFKILSKEYLKIPENTTKIMVCHEPPQNSKIGDASPFVPGSKGVARFLEVFEPDKFICGHIHESSGLEEIINKTSTFNSAQTYGIFEFDSEKNEIKKLNLLSD